MEGKKVDWTANALAMVSDIYDYLEDQAGDDVASDYIDTLLESAIVWMKNLNISRFVDIQNFRRRVIDVLNSAKPMLSFIKRMH